MTTQILEKIGDLAPSLAARGNDVHLDLRMHRQQAQQLHARVARAADNANLEHFHFADAAKPGILTDGRNPGRTAFRCWPATGRAGPGLKKQRGPKAP